MPTPKKKSPIRFAYSSAATVAIGFAAIAAWPYLSQAAEKLAAGEKVTPAAVKAEVQKEEKQREKKAEKDKALEPKAVLAQPDGTLWLGGKQGLYRWQDGKMSPVEFPGMEVRGLASAKDGAIWAAAKDGIWVKSGSEWKQASAGDFHGVAIAPDGAVIATGKQGVVRSTDGTRWEILKGTETNSKPDYKDGEKDDKGDKNNH